MNVPRHVVMTLTTAITTLFLATVANGQSGGTKLPPTPTQDPSLPSTPSPSSKPGIDPSTSTTPASPTRGAAQKPRGFSYFENRDLSADLLRRAEAATQARCEHACRANSACRAYSFDRWNRACFLKREPGELLINARSISGVASGIAKPPESARTITIEYFNGKTFAASGYVKRPAANRDQCEQICVADTACAAFTLVVAQKECRLYEQGTEYFPKSGHMSGAKRQ